MPDWLVELLRQGGFAACAALAIWGWMRKEKECTTLRAEVTKLVSDNANRVDKVNEARILEAMKSVEALGRATVALTDAADAMDEKRRRR